MTLASWCGNVRGDMDSLKFEVCLTFCESPWEPPMISVMLLVPLARSFCDFFASSSDAINCPSMQRAILNDVLLSFLSMRLPSSSMIFLIWDWFELLQLYSWICVILSLQKGLRRFMYSSHAWFRYFSFNFPTQSFGRRLRECCCFGWDARGWIFWRCDQWGIW